ncbi:MAG: RibD family protein [Roseibacillus sp.]
MDRPRILINFAISADGKIGTSQKGPSRFTSKADLDRLLQIRLRADAILVGRGTLEADEMSMTIPAELNPPKQPLRCIISRSGKFDSAHKVFHSPGGDIHLIATDTKEPFDEIPHTIPHLCSLEDFLARAKNELGVETLLCEGGGSLVKDLFAIDAIDEINLTLAGHSLIGGKNAPTITGIPSDFLPTSRDFKITHFEPTEDGELFATWSREETTTSP